MYANEQYVLVWNLLIHMLRGDKKWHVLDLHVLESRYYVGIDYLTERDLKPLLQNITLVFRNCRSNSK